MESLDPTLDQICAAYDLTPPVQLFDMIVPGINHRTLSLRAGSGEYVLKLYRATMDGPSLAYEHALLRRLASTGLSFALPAPLIARDGASTAQLPNGWAVLTPFLHGRCPELRIHNGRRPPEALADAEALGAAIGELHVALAGATLARRPGRSLFDSLFGFPAYDPLALTPEQAGFPDRAPYSELVAWWRDEAAELKAFVDRAYTALPQQICHNDMSPANVLVENGWVSAVLDWEFATVAARALDVAMGLRLVMQQWDDPAPWKYVSRFMRGYNRHTRMSAAELAALPVLLRLRNTIPGLWWLGGGGGSSVDPEHFRRRIVAMQQLTHWLDENGARLLETIAGVNGR